MDCRPLGVVPLPRLDGEQLLVLGTAALRVRSQRRQPLDAARRIAKGVENRSRVRADLLHGRNGRNGRNGRVFAPWAERGVRGAASRAGSVATVTMITVVTVVTAITVKR